MCATIRDGDSVPWSPPCGPRVRGCRHGWIIVERERVFLIETERFEPNVAGMEAAERGVFREYRWWTAAAIARLDEMFVPPGLGRLVGELLRDGVRGVVRVVDGVRLE